MGFFDKIKKVLSAGDDEANSFDIAIRDTFNECFAALPHSWRLDVYNTKAWSEDVKNWPDKKKVSFILYLLPRLHQFESKKSSWSSSDSEFQQYSIQFDYIHTLFRNKLLMEDEDAIAIYNGFVKFCSNSWSLFTRRPINLFLNQLEKQRKGQAISPSLREMLEEMKSTISNVQQTYGDKDRIKMIEKINVMLFASANTGTSVIKPAKFLGEDRFAEMANRAIQNMPQEQKVYWYQLLPVAQKASGAKPSAKYLAETKTIIQELGTDLFKKTMHEWLQFLVDLKEKEEQHSVSYDSGYTYNYTSYDFITSINADAIKGLIWICSHFHDNKSIQTIAALAERAYKKIPGKGPTAASLGNACLYVLYKSKGLDGVGQLSRLKLRIKQASTQVQIDKYLQAAANEQGVTVSEIEDMAVDDVGLEKGQRVFLFDDYKVELVIAGIGKTEQRWFKPDGSPQKSVPAIIKEKHSAKLKKLKETAKQAEQTLVAQRDRIDRMFRDGRAIPWAGFNQYYLQHGIMSYLVHKLIWNFNRSGIIVSATFLNGHWVNSNNEIVNIADTEFVSLWHPVQATVAAIKEWRDFFVFHQLQQPLKQAFREVYLLTDAELNTKSYSNRMAAHLLRQHQFNSLAKTRGWRYALMGAFDNGIDNDKASLLLPAYNLRAEYWIAEVNADNAMNDTGIWNYVTTDQVRFINTETNQTTDLIDIPSLVFSEVMRDVDLFVGVASVGNDPTWQDSGGLPSTYRDYWTSYSFGELSEVAKNRKDILSGLIPRLKIKDIATIKDKFLVVKGKLRTYKIHIGSTNILMEPNDQYLCIVPDRSAKNHTENLFLPFEGDIGLSIILSKAFLLADDDKITDSTIISQINKE